jgi:phospholipase C
MQALQNIHQQLSIASRAISQWSDSLCGDVIVGFTYNNEPKTTKTGI